MDAKPWEGIWPAEDLKAAKETFDRQHRPLSAGTRPALIIVDLTRAFVDSTYPTGYSETGVPCVEANVTLLRIARDAELPIFFTKGFADENYLATPAEIGRWKGVKLDGPRAQWPKKLPEGMPSGDVIVDELTPLPGEIVINKGGKPSGFFGTPLASFMIHAGCDTAIVTGMTTGGCVHATVVDAFQYNFHCIVPFECTAERRQLSYKVNLSDMHGRYADVISLDETIDYIKNLPKRSI